MDLRLRGSIFKIFGLTLLLTAGLMGVKYGLHLLGWEVISVGALHGSLITGVVFVIGFLMSTTISDYKEAERIPAETAAILEDMYEDVASIGVNYPKVAAEDIHKRLIEIGAAFATDLRRNTRTTHAKLHELYGSYAAMEKAGVPANFLVKLKQQQSVLLRNLLRVNYIQRITFIPSALVLAWSICALAIVTLLMTEVEPFIGGLLLTGALSFVLLYALQLMLLIRQPFHAKGGTMDDVSLFLIDQAIEHMKADGIEEKVAQSGRKEVNSQ